MVPLPISYLQRGCNSLNTLPTCVSYFLYLLKCELGSRNTHLVLSLYYLLLRIESFRIEGLVPKCGRDQSDVRKESL